jgi:RNA polymerase sigma-70 factor (ECF subfamily)
VLLRKRCVVSTVQSVEPYLEVSVDKAAKVTVNNIAGYRETFPFLLKPSYNVSRSKKMIRRSSKPEPELAASAIAGDAIACAELLAMHRPSLTALAQRLLRNREDASDAVQETLLKALKALPEFDPERPLGPWLCRICTNCCVDFARNRNRKPGTLEGHEETLADNGESVDETVGAAVLRSEVMKALERMPIQYRRILFMRHFQYKDVNQIAVELRKPEGTVKSWLFRARAQLRKELAIGLL